MRFIQKIIKKIVLITSCLLLLYNIPSYAKSADTGAIFPPRLRVGDTVGLVAPGYRVSEDIKIKYAIERMQALGLKVKLGKSVYQRHGYFSGTDIERAKDINQMFKDKKIKAIIALRGGWGSNRILDLLDYKIIKKTPKIIMGYSDITSLLLAINAKTGLVTFHGPMAALPWTEFTTKYAKDVLFNADKVSFSNPIEEDEDDLIQTKNRIITIREGKATGRFLGGSLTLLTSLIGSQYLPKFDGAILFIEDVDEGIYRVDRMLTQLKTAGILNKIAGFVFGKCTGCSVSDGSYGSLTLQQVLKKHILPLKIPAWYGSMIGHEDKIFTVPEGSKVIIDAESGTIRMLESAVK